MNWFNVAFVFTYYILKKKEEKNTVTTICPWIFVFLENVLFNLLCWFVFYNEEKKSFYFNLSFAYV